MKKQFKRDIVVLSRAWNEYLHSTSNQARAAFNRFWDLLEATATKYDVDIHALAGCVRIKEV